MLFGDDEPPPPIGAVLGPWSRLRKDSSMFKGHPDAGTIVDNSNFETNIGTATPGIAPSQTYGSTSGIIFNGSNWIAGSHGQGFGASVNSYYGERGATGSATHGGMGTWSFANASGMTVCGW
ncbi:MAG: hypothetical protein R3330_12460, partial [Saprospiraceae bacterium]|nr:hypothetical protein [Saprospiraceae bacterium]